MSITITINPEVRFHRVSRYLYSHFAEHLGRCIYEGIWVGEDATIDNGRGIRRDTTAALKKLALPALRWPGGCFADNYHWQDGIGPREQRPRRRNVWWNQVESNAFGTDEYMRLCEMIDAEPYICLNVGSGTVEEARAWVEYCNAKQDTTLVRQRRANGHPEPYNVRFWGIGNENWGCGGTMRPAYYADLYRRFATYVRRTAGDEAKLIACGSHVRIPEWDERFLEAMKGVLGLVDYLALHIYSGGGSSDVAFSDEEYYRLIGSIDIMDKHLHRTCGLAQAYSSHGHPIGVLLDEWGTWYKEANMHSGHYQQNTMRDALFAAASFHCFHQHSARLFMTNMAQTVNVLQALVLTRGPEMIVTPTYHVYEMFQPHRDGDLVACTVANGSLLRLPGERQCAALSVSATRSPQGDELFVSVVNLDLTNAYQSLLRLAGEQNWTVDQVCRLGTGDIRGHNTFAEPNRVAPVQVPLEPEQSIGQGQGEGVTLTFPAQSISTLSIRLGKNA